MRVRTKAIEVLLNDLGDAFVIFGNSRYDMLVSACFRFSDRLYFITGAAFRWRAYATDRHHLLWYFARAIAEEFAAEFGGALLGWTAPTDNGSMSALPPKADRCN
jgi:hypothetical protein